MDLIINFYYLVKDLNDTIRYPKNNYSVPCREKLVA